MNTITITIAATSLLIIGCASTPDAGGKSASMAEECADIHATHYLMSNELERGIDRCGSSPIESPACSGPILTADFHDRLTTVTNQSRLCTDIGYLPNRRQIAQVMRISPKYSAFSEKMNRHVKGL